jgi:LytS/YehU family sensor histidine kinase
VLVTTTVFVTVLGVASDELSLLSPPQPIRTTAVAQSMQHKETTNSTEALLAVIVTPPWGESPVVGFIVYKYRAKRNFSAIDSAMGIEKGRKKIK